MADVTHRLRMLSVYVRKLIILILAVLRQAINGDLYNETRVFQPVSCQNDEFPGNIQFYVPRIWVRDLIYKINT